MTPIPVICDDCHRLWIDERAVGVEGGGSVRAVFTGTKISPCPFCGGVGSVPDGIYELGEETSQILAGLGVAKLQALLEIVTVAQRDNVDEAVLVKRIEREVPDASGLRNLFGKSGTPFREWLIIIIALITLLLPRIDSGDKPLTQLQTKQAFVQALEQVQREMNSPVRSKKIGRNEPCFCGSGKKSKHCHGQ